VFNDTHRKIIYQVTATYYRLLIGQQGAAKAMLVNAQTVQRDAVERLNHGLRSSLTCWKQGLLPRRQITTCRLRSVRKRLATEIFRRLLDSRRALSFVFRTSANFRFPMHSHLSALRTESPSAWNRR
jgi:hypothetical protein